MKHQTIKKSILACIISPLWGVGGLAQTIIQDKANYGQEERMVYLKWNNWSPDPTTDWIGILNNIQGWLFWNILNHSYYKGGDQRPYRTGGPFDQNYAALKLQQNTDYQLRDTTNAMLNIWLTTDLNMTGGAADAPYTAYFKDKFASLNKDITGALTLLNRASQQLYNEMANSTWGKNCMERLNVINERINTTHSVYADRGKRMVNYFNILNELQSLREHMVAYLYSWYNMTKLPPLALFKTGSPASVPNTDQKIVQQILKTWKAD